MTFLLDTSALLLHYFKAPGADQIHRIICDGKNSILVATGCDPMEARSSALSYASLCERVVPVDAAASVRAFELGVAIPADLLPQLDATS